MLIPSLVLAAPAVLELEFYEKQIFSEHGEDGIIEKLVSLLDSEEKYYVNLGPGDGVSCNTRYLRENLDYHGIMIDDTHQDLSVGLFKEYISKENVLNIFKKYEVPREFDIISISLDGMDYYIWSKIGKVYRPKIVVIEFNASEGIESDKILVYNPSYKKDNSNSFSSSLQALQKLGKGLGYTLVYVGKQANNLFFMREDILKNKKFYLNGAGNRKFLFRNRH